MTEREAAIISAYTGVMIGSFSALHKYAEEIMSRPINTIEFANKSIMEEIKNKSKEDFCNIRVE